MNVQIFLFITFIVIAVSSITEKSEENLTSDDIKFVEFFCQSYCILAAILPILQIQWFNRTWLFKCIPKRVPKDSDDFKSLAANASIQQDGEGSELETKVN